MKTGIISSSSFFPSTPWTLESWSPFTNGYVYYSILSVIPTCSESFFNYLISKERFPTRFACVNDSHEALLRYVLVNHESH